MFNSEMKMRRKQKFEQNGTASPTFTYVADNRARWVRQRKLDASVDTYNVYRHLTARVWKSKIKI